MNISITGANSSVGKSLLRHIAKRDDVTATAGVRSKEALESLPISPRITPRLISYGDLDTLTPLLDRVSCVVHLTGVLFERGRSVYQRVNVETTRAIVDASKRANVNHMVFISVIGAAVDSANRYFSSKGQAERIVADSGLSSTIIRTPILLGPDTAGAHSLVTLASRKSANVLGGGHYLMRPLDVDDLTQAILRCCRVQAAGVAIHDLVGPRPTTYRDLITKTSLLMGHDIQVGSTPIWLAKVAAAIVSGITRSGITPTVIDVITSDETVRRNADTDLGVNLTPLCATLQKLLDNKTQSR